MARGVPALTAAIFVFNPSALYINRRESELSSGSAGRGSLLAATMAYDHSAKCLAIAAAGMTELP